MVNVLRIDERLLRRGDVLLLERGHQLFCHRLVRQMEQDGRYYLCYARRLPLLLGPAHFAGESLLGRVALPRGRRFAVPLRALTAGDLPHLPASVSLWLRRRVRADLQA